MQHTCILKIQREDGTFAERMFVLRPDGQLWAADLFYPNGEMMTIDLLAKAPLVFCVFEEVLSELDYPNLFEGVNNGREGNVLNVEGAI